MCKFALKDCVNRSLVRALPPILRVMCLLLFVFVSLDSLDSIGCTELRAKNNLAGDSPAGDSGADKDWECPHVVLIDADES